MNADRYSWADGYPWNAGRTWMGDALAIGTVLLAVVLLVMWWRNLVVWDNTIDTVAALLFAAQVILLACYLAIELRERAIERQWERRYRVWVEIQKRTA